MGGRLRFEAIRRLGIVVTLLVLGLVGHAADPVVLNVGFAQRPGTKLVDISYDLQADGEVEISVSVSADDGATWTVPAASLTGDVGSGIATGVGKAIVWDGGTDWDDQHTAQLRVRITATQADVPAQGDYLVIDLAVGSEAASYPVSYLAAVPEGGWTEEYKTTKLVLRRIPAGIFTMGSPEGELGRETDDEPQHQVTLTRDLYVGVFAVTQKQWERVMGTWPSYFANEDVRDARPVEQVSWNEVRGGVWPGDPAGSGAPAAGAFVQKLRERTGIDFDLPTEAQWEYACRAGTTTALNSGKELTDEYECPRLAEVGRYWYNGGSGYTQNGDTSVGSAKAGSYLPNAWGLHDMHGNVWEWCLDWYGSYPGAVTDPVGPATGSFRLNRGGGWVGHAGICRAAFRGGRTPADQSYFVGFRLAAPIPAPRTVTFDLGEQGTRTGGGALTQQVANGAAATAPTFTVAPGWTFLGWSAGFAEVTADLTVTALYEALPFLVIDLAAGPEAASYPISYLAAVPEGGWTEEYKTTKLVLRRIPAGTFAMGSPEGELGRYDDETQHQVTLTKDFHIGVFEVTQRQWERVMGDWPSYFSNETVRDARPVEQVSWDGIRGGTWPGDPAGSGAPAAGAFVQKLRERTGIDFDLPTEAQWEYACRAGTTTALNSGKDLTDVTQCPNVAEVARYRHNHPGGYSNSSDVGLEGGTAAAGSYLANAWGLSDLHGNVLEWCLDCFATYPGTVSDPLGPATGSYRVIRGGSCAESAEVARAAFRDYYGSDVRDYVVGFRLAAPMPISYTVIFDLGEQGTRTGGGALVQQVANGAAATAPTFTVAPGWTFLGWSAEFAEVTSDRTVTALYESSPYLVIDLAAGPEAASYPVSYLAAVPEGGWTEEHKTTKLVLRRIPAGIFTMGSPEGELGRVENETQHPVTLTKDFHIGVFEVTQKQWERVMGTWPSYFSDGTVRDARPVEQVSWDGIRGGPWPGDPAGSGIPVAGTFVQKLRDRTGIDFDLPTEAQWEYACRAGTPTALNSGKDLTDEYECPNMAEVGRYWANGGEGGWDTPGVGPEGGTATVGSYLPNAWGLYDLHGNVWEQCLDWMEPYAGPVTDPVGATTGESRVHRGGGWDADPWYSRSAYRTTWSYDETGTDRHVGFRLAGPAVPDAPAVSGTVTGAVRGGVTITLAGLASAQTVTAADGTYAFANLLPGGYTLTASAEGYAFLPATAGVAVGTTDRMGVDFTAQPGSREDRVVDAETGGVISQADGSGEVSIPGGFLVPATGGGVRVTSLAMAAPPFGLATGAAAVTGTAVLELPGEAIPSATDCDGSFAFHVSSLGQRGGANPAYCLASVRIEFYMTDDPSVRYSEELFGVPVESGQRGPLDWTVNVSASTMAKVRRGAERAYDGTVFGAELAWDGVTFGAGLVWDGTKFVARGVVRGVKVVVVATVITTELLFDYAVLWPIRMGIEVYTYCSVRTFIARWNPTAGTSGEFVAATTDDLAGKRVVVFLHGWQALGGADTAALNPHVTTWERLARYATGPWAGSAADDYVYYTVRYDSDHRIYDSALAVRKLLAETFPNQRVIIVAHSMGGMVAHAMEQQYHPDGTAFAPWPNGGIERIISLNTPYHGTPFVQAVDEGADLTLLDPSLWPVGAVVNGAMAFLALATPGTLDLAWDNYDSNLRILPGYANADLLALNQREPTDLRSRYCTFGTTIVSPSRSVVDDAMKYVSGPVVAFMGYANDGIVPKESAHLRGAGDTVRTTEVGASLPHGTYNHFKIYEGAGIDPSNPSFFDTLLYDDILSYLTPVGVGLAGDYLVIDLAAGPTATSYPVCHLDAAPAGGWTDEYKTTKLVLRRIPAGTFTMGSPEGELGRYDNETQHQVTLTKDFYVGVFEVTQRQYERVMGTWPSYFSNTTYRDARPVEWMSWNDMRGGTWPGDPAGSGLPAAGTFVHKLRDRTSIDFDLPTEAQWEYACRAGTTTALNSGTDLTDMVQCPNLAEVGRYWYNGGSGSTKDGDSSVGSATVGSYLPNFWGLYDMHGNVYEWCLDWSEPYPTGVAFNPLGPASGSYRMSRSCSFYTGNIARHLRSAFRLGVSPSWRFFDTGFRLAAPAGRE